MEKWSTEHVQLWVQYAKLPDRVAQVFRDFEVDGKDLSELKDFELAELGVTRKLTRFRIIAARNKTVHEDSPHPFMFAEEEEEGEPQQANIPRSMTLSSKMLLPKLPPRPSLQKKTGKQAPTNAQPPSKKKLTTSFSSGEITLHSENTRGNPFLVLESQAEMDEESSSDATLNSKMFGRRNRSASVLDESDNRNQDDMLDSRFFGKRGNVSPRATNRNNSSAIEQQPLDAVSDPRFFGSRFSVRANTVSLSPVKRAEARKKHMERIHSTPTLPAYNPSAYTRPVSRSRSNPIEDIAENDAVSEDKGLYDNVNKDGLQLNEGDETQSNSSSDENSEEDVSVLNPLLFGGKNTHLYISDFDEHVEDQEEEPSASELQSAITQKSNKNENENAKAPYDDVYTIDDADLYGDSEDNEEDFEIDPRLFGPRRSQSFKTSTSQNQQQEPHYQEQKQRNQQQMKQHHQHQHKRPAEHSRKTDNASSAPRSGWVHKQSPQQKFLIAQKQMQLSKFRQQQQQQQQQQQWQQQHKQQTQQKHVQKKHPNQMLPEESLKHLQAAMSRMSAAIERSPAPHAQHQQPKPLKKTQKQQQKKATWLEDGEEEFDLDNMEDELFQLGEEWRNSNSQSNGKGLPPPLSLMREDDEKVGDGDHQYDDILDPDYEQLCDEVGCEGGDLCTHIQRFDENEREGTRKIGEESEDRSYMRPIDIVVQIGDTIYEVNDGTRNKATKKGGKSEEPEEDDEVYDFIWEAHSGIQGLSPTGVIDRDQ